MTPRIRDAAAAACLAIALAAGGCDSGRKRPPQVSVRVVHAAPSRPSLEFLRGELPTSTGGLAATLEFRQASAPLTFDADAYTFHVDPANAQGRYASFSAELAPGYDYLIVLSDDAGAIEPIIVETPAFESTSDAQVVVVHGAVSVGELDVYLEPAGTDLTTATPVGTAAFGAPTEPVTRAPGDYRVTVTEPGDPAAVLLASPATLTLEAGERMSLVVVDGAGDLVAPFAVVAAGAATNLLIDAATQSTLDVVNSAADTAPRDVFVDGDFTAPLFSALEFAEVSATVSIAPGDRNLSVTPAGNPGVVEAEHEADIARGRVYTALIAGEPGELSLVTVLDDRRRIAEVALVRFMNGASQFTPLEFFLVPPGTDITGFNSLIAVAAPGIAQRTLIVPGEYDLLVRDLDTQAVVAGPIPVELTEGLYTILAINGETSASPDLVFLEDFN